MENFTKYHFTGQKNNEKILAVLHRHWFDILIQFFMIISMLLILFGSFIYLPLIYPPLNEAPVKNLFLFLENSLFLMTWILGFLIWVDYYFDVWIVTDQRIVNIEQRGLFARVVSELELENIQDITSDVSGFIPTILNYGDLFVQTAAEKERFVFHNIPDPYRIKDLVMNLQKKYEHKEEQEFGEMLRKKIHKEPL